MHYSRRQPRVAPTGRITVRLSTDQRDLFIKASEVPRDLAHALHRAPVRGGKLSIRITREFLDALIAAAAKSQAPDRRAERDLVALLGYLEGLEERFETTDDTTESDEG
ncbi:MAG: hypothetical protein K0R17_2350 [Rariglobus sp.]|jgi:uncharacterized protein (DUF1778 family)|nr:hypothetical protein [Rariglobus sp.]